MLRVAAIALWAALGAVACDRVPEQALRDEQNRAREYRDAYEAEHDENVALKAKLDAAEQTKACAATK
jgi:hypothetical protein